jgi:hypothetical protein
VSRESHLSRVNIDHFPMILIGPTSVVTHGMGGFHDIPTSGDLSVERRARGMISLGPRTKQGGNGTYGEGFPVVERFEGGEFVGVLLHQVGELDQKLSSC